MFAPLYCDEKKPKEATCYIFHQEKVEWSNSGTSTMEIWWKNSLSIYAGPVTYSVVYHRGHEIVHEKKTVRKQWLSLIFGRGGNRTLLVRG